ncbi:IPT/TIG domain-containing protein [Streptomyces microflavus]|uniref:IPT/TIG domain-containing protein n=1 Tax=Streptomyces microflavus TaxID=1919 RepID=UPI002E111673|nr:IPT/TIG domain-containing protein [Streptomyces microflavus]WSR95818.1 IPT/TIG domain-containing protein [Streptomyces microflavus]
MTGLVALAAGPAAAAPPTVIATVDTGYGADTVVVAPDGNTVYVGNAGQNRINTLDTATDTITSTFSSGGPGPFGLAVNPAGTVLYSTDVDGDSVHVIDAANQTVTATVPVGVDPQGVVVTPDGSRAYVANNSDSSVSVIDTATNTVTATVAVGTFPYGAAVTSDGSRVYVSAENQVSVIDTATNTVTATIAATGSLRGIVVSPDGTKVYAASSFGDGSVVVINTATNTVSSTIAASSDTGALAVSPDGTRLYTGSYGAVNVIDVATATVDSSVATNFVYALAVNADGTRLYAGNGDNVTVLGVAPPVAAPAVTGISPSSGTTAGGTSVTITGTDLNGATSIDFGGTPATAISCTATSCTATSPAHAAGAVHVRVTTPGGTSPATAADQFTYNALAADIDVNVAGQPHLGILVPYLTYTLTAHNTGPNAVTSATVKATLPPGAVATNLSTGCTTSTGTVTCTYGAIANGAGTSKSFRVPLHLFSLGQVTVTGTRTASAPTDNNPANDSASATCTVVSIVLATCP